MENHSFVVFIRNEVRKALYTNLTFKEIPFFYIGLSDENSGWLDTLKSLNNKKTTNPDKEFYRLFAHLEPFRYLEEEKNSSNYFTPQRSGTCSIKSILVSLRGQFASIEEYKRFKIEFKYSTLNKFYREFLTDLPVDNQDKRIFLDSCNKLLRSVAKAQMNGIISLESAGEITHSIIEMQQSASLCIVRPEPKSEVFVATKKLALTDDFKVVDAPPGVFSLSRYDIVDLSDLSFKNLNIKMVNLRTELEKKSDLGLCQFEKFAEMVFEKVCIDPDFERELLSEKIDSLVNGFHELHVLYVQQIQEKCRGNPRFFNTNWQSLAIFYTLFKIKNPYLQKYIPSLESLHTCSWENRAINKDDIERYTKIRSFFQNQRSSDSESVEIFKIHYGVYYIKDESLPMLPEVFFLKELVSKDSNLPSMISKKKNMLIHFCKTKTVELSENVIESLAILQNKREILTVSKMLPLASAILTSQDSPFDYTVFERDYHYYSISNGGGISTNFLRRNYSMAGEGYDNINNQEFSLRMLALNGKSVDGEVWQENKLLHLKLILDSDKSSINFSQHSLTCDKTLYDFDGDRFLDLTSAEVRQECLYAFFILDKRGRPLIEERINEEVFRDRFFQWISRGINYYYRNPADGRPDVGVVIFLLDLLQRTSEFLSDGHIIDAERLNAEEIVGSLLADPRFSKKEQILANMLNILLISKKSSLEDRDLFSAAKSWFFLNDNMDVDQSLPNLYWIKPNVDLYFFQYKEEMIRGYYKILPLIQTVDTANFAKEYLGIEQDIEWKMDNFPIITDNQSWKIDFVKGKVIFDNRVLQNQLHKCFADHYDFFDVFGNERSREERIVQYINGAYLFEEQNGYSFRIVGDKLQLMISEDWYQYIPACIAGSHLPYSLLIDHHVFRNGKNVILIDKETLMKSYQTNENGELVNLDTQRKCYFEKDVSEINAIEHKDWVLIEQDDQERKYIYIPRLKSSLDDSECLYFYQMIKDGPYLYSKDPNFHIAPTFPSLAIPTKNFLVLKNDALGTTKVLIPVIKGMREFGYALKTTLDIERGKSERFDSIENFQKELVAEYEFDRYSLTPVTLEARLHLCYLHLLCRNYHESLAILSELPKHTNFSKESIQILENIVLIPDQTSSSTPSSIAVALKALSVMPKENRNFDNESILSLICKYYGGFNNIEPTLHIDQEILDGLSDVKYRRKDNSITRFLGNKTSNLLLGINSYDDIFLEMQSNLYTRILEEADPEKKLSIYLEGFKDHSHPSIFSLIAAIWPKINHLFPGVTLPTEHSSVLRYDSPFNQELRAKLCKNQHIIFRELYKRQTITDISKAAGFDFKNEMKIEPIAISYDVPLSEIQRESFVEIEPISKNNNTFEGFQINQQDNDSVSYEKTKINASISSAKEIEDILYKPKEGFKRLLTNQELKFERDCKELEVEILVRANKRPVEPEVNLLSEQLKSSGSILNPSIAMLVTAFLNGDIGSYKKINPHLSNKEIKELDNRIKHYLQKSCDLMQIQRTLAHNDEIAAQEIASPVCYRSDDEHFRLFLVFEYKADLRIRKPQVELLTKMLEKDSLTGNYQNRVAQMMMGGGKTSVLTSILLHKACKKGRIPMLIAPSTQYETLSSDLAQRQQKNFYSKISPIQFNREQLSIENLTLIQQNLNDAKERGEAILTTAETIQALQLELEELMLNEGLQEGATSLADYFVQFLPWQASKIMSKASGDVRLDCLKQIMQDIKLNADVLIDEVDVILSTKNEMIFSQGERKPISPLALNMVRQVIGYHLEEGSLEILENKQASFGKQNYINQVLGTIKERFFDEHPDLRDYQNIIFGEKKEIASDLDIQVRDKILIAKEIFEFLPVTLEKSARQKFDRKPGEEKVIPYLAAGNPSTKEFGSNVEAALYHFLTILAKKGEMDCLVSVAHRLKKQAITQSLQTNKSIQETDADKKFFSITNTHLLEFCAPNSIEVRQHVLEAINQHPDKLLDIEEQSIKHCVGYYEKYISSDSQRLVKLFSSVRCFSGTPWNQHAYDSSLASLDLLDPQTEGQILLTCLNKSSEVKCGIEGSLDGVLASLPEKACGYIDACGMLKDQDNKRVAEKILGHYSEDPNILAVLYFDEKDQLCALKKRDDREFSCILIKSTQKKEIEKRGIDLSKCFVYYDERHCEATDIAQKDDALNGIGISHKTSLRTLMQSLLRLRKFFKGQDVVYLISHDEMKHFPQETKVADIIEKAIENQAEEKSEEFIRSLKHKLSACVKDHILQQVLSSSGSLARFSDLFESQIDQRKLTFDEYYNLLVEQIKNNPGIQNKRKLRMYLESLYLSLKESPYFSDQGSFQGMEVSIQAQTQEEVSKELMQELRSYSNTYINDAPYTEIIFEELKPEYFTKKSYSAGSAKSHAQKTYGLEPIIPEKYRPLFPDNILITSNFGLCGQSFLPIFCPKQKPIKQILVINKRDQSCDLVLLSSNEADKAKQCLEASSRTDMFLILPDGSSYTNQYIEEQVKIKILESLWHVNFMAGNIDYLCRNEDLTKRLMQEKKELRKDYLMLKLSVDSPKLRQLEDNPIFL